MRISDWSSDVCSSDLALAGEVGGQGEGLLDVLLGQHVGAGGHVAHEGHVAYGTPVDRRTGGGVEAHFDGAGLGVVAAQEAKLLEGAEVGVHSGGRGEADLGADVDRKSTRLNSSH